MFRDSSVFVTGLAGEEVFDLLDEDVAAHVGDGFGEGKLLGAGLDAVLGEAALLDAAVSGEGAEAFFLEDCAAGVHVEELCLRDGGCADEAGGVVELRADLHADGAGDAVGERVATSSSRRSKTSSPANPVTNTEESRNIYRHKIWVSHLSDNLIVAKVGIRAEAQTAFPLPATDRTSTPLTAKE